MALVSFNGSSISKGNKYLSLNAAAVAGGVQQVKATGGTEQTSGVYRVHTFNSSGTFTLNVRTAVEYIIVSGGQGAMGGSDYYGDFILQAGGAAAGNYVVGSVVLDPGNYSVLVGAGGARGGLAPAPTSGGAGAPSSFGPISVAGPSTATSLNNSGGSNANFSGGACGGGGFPGAAGIGGGGAGMGQNGFPFMIRQNGSTNYGFEVTTTGAGVGGSGVTINWLPTPRIFGGGGNGGAAWSITGPPSNANPQGFPQVISSYRNTPVYGGGLGAFLNRQSFPAIIRSSEAAQANSGGGGGGGAGAANVDLRVPAPQAPTIRGSAGGSGFVMIRYVI